MSEAKCLSADELRELGLLQEVNRQFFHPLGLAMFVDEKGSMGVFDWRDDPEGGFFDKADVLANRDDYLMKIAQVAGQRSLKYVSRLRWARENGYEVYPDGEQAIWEQVKES